jgi:uncharacterized membrane protein YvlD (DUF360 family)
MDHQRARPPGSAVYLRIHQGRQLLHSIGYGTLIRPVLIVLTLPINVLTLGFFTLVINGLLFWFVASFVRGFYVAGFWSAVGGAIIYSVLSWALSSLLLRDKKTN